MEHRNSTKKNGTKDSKNLIITKNWYNKNLKKYKK